MTDDFLSPDTMTEQYVHWFGTFAPYINAHGAMTFVLMFGGEAVNHDNFRNIIHDIALLHSLGIHLVLVHGARPQIDENLIEYGLSFVTKGLLSIRADCHVVNIVYLVIHYFLK